MNPAHEEQKSLVNWLPGRLCCTARDKRFAQVICERLVDAGSEGLCFLLKGVTLGEAPEEAPMRCKLSYALVLLAATLRPTAVAAALRITKAKLRDGNFMGALGGPRWSARFS